MNVFEFLGLNKDHRAKNKVVQLVKHFAEVNPKHEEGILHKKVSFPMYAQCKRDGVFSMLVVRVDGKCGIFGRTGEQLANTENLVSYYEGLVIIGNLSCGVYFGEMVTGCEYTLEQLSGVLNPNRTKELETREQKYIKHNLYIAFFDCVSICEFISGHSHRKFKQRYDALFQQLAATECVLDIDVVNNVEELMQYADRLIKLGHEGAVFKQDVGWLAGAKDWHQMKVVRRYEVDLECIGWEEGTGKYTGLVANLLFRYKGGNTVKAMLGKGWTHVDAMSMFKCIQRGHSGDEQGYFPWSQPIGKIFRVYGLQPSSKNGVIRLPKVGDLRFDKTEPDF
ncbi:DNA ligase [Vibrio phage VEN]|uniref:DNA ligase n=1 Tax=Vibrio phage VEN TaxID=2059879 RepID=A0A2H5BMV8_9CAUD|nr:DNA ligase [Vibrio phage VEN]AUG87660.1 DNA ligase [Vibrio phage VEN]